MSPVSPGLKQILSSIDSTSATAPGASLHTGQRISRRLQYSFICATFPGLIQTFAGHSGELRWARGESLARSPGRRAGDDCRGERAGRSRRARAGGCWALVTALGELVFIVPEGASVSLQTFLWKISSTEKGHVWSNRTFSWWRCSLSVLCRMGVASHMRLSSTSDVVNVTQELNFNFILL